MSTVQQQPRPSTTPARSTDHRRQAWRTVMVREVMVKLTNKSFIVSTLVSLLLVLGGVGVSVWLQERAETTKLVATTAAAEQLGHALDAQVKQQNPKNAVVVSRVADATAAEQALRSKKADVWLAPQGQGWQLVLKRGSKDSLQTATQQVLQAQVMARTAARAGTSMAQLAQQTAVDSRALEGDSSRSNLARALGLIFGMLFMMSALTYGMQIATSVIEEKQSRIVEILAAAIPVRQLLAGKVLGNSLMALLQMALLVSVGLAGMSFTSYSSLVPAMSGAIVWFLLLFLAGFGALACVWAAAGAMCTRSEDLQQTSQPLVFLLMGCYMAGFLATGTVRVVLSFLPVVSTVTMPVRLVEGSAHWWEGLVALLVDLVFAALTVRLGERIYRGALLQTQGRLSYKEAVKLSR